MCDTMLSKPRASDTVNVSFKPRVGERFGSLDELGASLIVNIRGSGSPIIFIETDNMSETAKEFRVAIARVEDSDMRAAYTSELERLLR
jgi:hypothetical protein